MAAETKYLFLLAVCLSSASVVLSQIPSEDATTGVEQNILRSLTKLNNLLNDTQCEDRVWTLWKDVKGLTSGLKRAQDLLMDYLDKLNYITYDNKPLEECPSSFPKVGDTCLRSYRDQSFPWWRSRTFCFFHGGELVQPKDVHVIRELVGEGDSGRFWLGARTLENLEFPDWKAVNGETVWSEYANHTTIPRNSSEENCLYVDAGSDYEIRSANCEEKMLTVCQKKFKHCPIRNAMIGSDCIRIDYWVKTWNKASTSCTLAIPKDIERIRQYADSVFDGVERLRGKWQMWIGYPKDDPDWIVKWSNLTRQQGDDVTDILGGKCLAMQHGDGHPLTLVDCNETLYYLCR